MILNDANDYWGSIVARYRASPVPGFLAWWRGELAGLLPSGLRRRMVPPRPSLWLVAEGEDTDMVLWRGGDRPEQLARFSGQEDVQVLRKRWMEALNRFDDGSPEIRLCLPSSSVLECPVELPLAVESNLDSALGYQLDQLTPFKASDVYYDYRITGRNTRSGRLELDLRLVPIARVNDLTERLAAIGIRPHAIDTVKDDREVPLCEHFNLLPEGQRPRYVYARARLNWILAGVAIVVLALVMTQSLYLRNRTVDQLQSEVAALRAEAETVLALQRQLEDSLQAANFLAERRRRQPVVIQVLDEISRILPNDMWINQMQVRGNELMMMGLADGSQRLIEIINDSSLLSDAEFRGAINVDPATGQERFNARATIIRRGGMQNATVAESGE